MSDDWAFDARPPIPERHLRRRRVPGQPHQTAAAPDYGQLLARESARLGEARAVIEQVRALVESPPLLLSGIERDQQRTPAGRGGTVRHNPATDGVGAGGCPGDTLTGWLNDLRAALDGEPDGS